MCVCVCVCVCVFVTVLCLGDQNNRALQVRHFTLPLRHSFSLSKASISHKMSQSIENKLKRHKATAYRIDFFLNGPATATSICEVAILINMV